MRLPLILPSLQLQILCNHQMVIKLHHRQFPLDQLFLYKETTDPAEIADGGVLLPFGGYKGSAIAMMVELMAGALVGDNFSFETAAKDNNDGGHHHYYLWQQFQN